MSGRVVHVNDNVPGAVYIGRAVPRRGLSASFWQNLFKISEERDRAEAVELYRRSFVGVEQWRRLPDIRGKPLACWCRHDGEGRTDKNACHGDVLLELLDRYTDDELRAMGGAK